MAVCGTRSSKKLKVPKEDLSKESLIVANLIAEIVRRSVLGKEAAA
jgi:hypothetical protein